MHRKFAFSLASVAVMIGTPALASTPATFWQGVERLLVSCTAAPGVDRELVSRICERVVKDAQIGSPYPVVQNIASSAASARDVVLNVTASRSSGGQIKISITAERSDPRSEEPVSIWRGPGGPRQSSGDDRAVDELVTAELNFALPWRTNGIAGNIGNRS